jgi:gluconate kinase
MKHLLIALTLALGSQFVIAEEPKKETKRVCVDVKDKQGQPVKDAKGKVKQNCKEVKIHKKLEDATAVPVKK